MITCLNRYQRLVGTFENTDVSIRTAPEDPSFCDDQYLRLLNINQIVQLSSVMEIKMMEHSF